MRKSLEETYTSTPFTPDTSYTFYARQHFTKVRSMRSKSLWGRLAWPLQGWHAQVSIELLVVIGHGMKHPCIIHEVRVVPCKKFRMVAEHWSLLTRASCHSGWWSPRVTFLTDWTVYLENYTWTPLSIRRRWQSPAKWKRMPRHSVVHSKIWKCAFYQAAYTARFATVFDTRRASCKMRVSPQFRWGACKICVPLQFWTSDEHKTMKMFIIFVSPQFWPFQQPCSTAFLSSLSQQPFSPACLSSHPQPSSRCGQGLVVS